MQREQRSLLLLTALACGGSGPVGPPASVPALGRYAIVAQPYPPDHQASGTLVIMYASADSIAGVMQSLEFDPEVRLGFKNAGAYLIYVGVITAGGRTMGLRLTPSGSGLTCASAQFIPSSTTFPCSVSYLGP